MTTGVVTTVGPRFFGDTLTAATASGGLVLSVDDAGDFAEDEDFAGGLQWLTIGVGAGSSGPLQYVAADEDADTVTLATAVGAVYEAGEPVRMWDPAIGTGGGHVVEFVATVRLDTAGPGDSPVPAIIRPTDVMFAEVDDLKALVGAQVRIAQDPDAEPDDEWFVAEIIGQAPPIAARYVLAPRGLASRSTTFSVLAGTTTEVPLLTRDATFSTDEWTLDAGRLTYHGPPCVAVVYAGVKWAANGTGYRRAIIRQSSVLDSLTINQVDPDTSGQPSYHSTAGVFTLADGESIYVDVRQTSGASLDLIKAELRAAIVGYQQ